MKKNEFLNYFKGLKSTSKNQWVALCPAHNDHKPSLSIKYDESNDKIILHCFAGCDVQDILCSIGLKMKDLYPDNTTNKSKVFKETSYHYYKVNGELAYSKTRIDYDGGTKKFYFEQPNGQKNLNGVSRVPYNLPAVCKASKVYIVEGEKCAEAVISQGRVATTFDNGSNVKWNDTFYEYFKDKEIVIIPDNDTPGYKYAKTLKDNLPEAKVVLLPNLREKEDIYDWLKAGHTMNEFDNLPSVDICKYFSNENEVTEVDNRKSKNSSGERTQSQVLIKLIKDNGTVLFHDDKNLLYAAVNDNGHRKIWGIESEMFKSWLNLLYYRKTNSTISKKSFDEAYSQIKAFARFDCENEINLFVRVAKSNNNTFWYDLTNNEWQTVKITADGWFIEDKPPILFCRYNHQRSQIKPHSNGDIRQILKYVNIQNNHTLFLCWLVTCFVPDIPHAMPILYGEKGAAKSTACEFLKTIIDPSALETLMLNDIKSLIVNLQQHWFLPFDNVSALSIEKSDILCRAITGGGIQQRKLYTNADDYIFNFKRCIAINGINNVAFRSDLIDRAIMIELSRIDEESRKEITEIRYEFEKDLPYILGGIFDVLSKAMLIYPTLCLERLPRMADFARWGYAIGEALGGLGQTFLDEYQKNQSDRDNEILSSDIVAVIVISFMNGLNEWTGTVSELYLRLTQLAPKIGINTRSKEFPARANYLSKRMKAIRSNLKSTGISFEFKKKSDATYITIVNENISPLPPYRHPNIDGLICSSNENTEMLIASQENEDNVDF